MTRLTSDFWVKALVRRVYGDGGFAAIERAGAPEAGAIFVRVRGKGGAETLLAPAPQSLFETANSGERLFELRIAKGSGTDVDAVLAREAGFDPDMWVVEIETDHPETYIEIMPDAPDA